MRKSLCFMLSFFLLFASLVFSQEIKDSQATQSLKLKLIGKWKLHEQCEDLKNCALYTQKPIIFYFKPDGELIVQENSQTETARYTLNQNQISITLAQDTFSSEIISVDEQELLIKIKEKRYARFKKIALADTKTGKEELKLENIVGRWKVFGTNCDKNAICQQDESAKDYWIEFSQGNAGQLKDQKIIDFTYQFSGNEILIHVQGEKMPIQVILHSYHEQKLLLEIQGKGYVLLKKNPPLVLTDSVIKPRMLFGKWKIFSKQCDANGICRKAQENSTYWLEFKENGTGLISGSPNQAFTYTLTGNILTLYSKQQEKEVCEIKALSDTEILLKVLKDQDYIKLQRLE